MDKPPALLSMWNLAMILVLREIGGGLVFLWWTFRGGGDVGGVGDVTLLRTGLASGIHNSFFHFVVICSVSNFICFSLERWDIKESPRRKLSWSWKHCIVLLNLWSLKLMRDHFFIHKRQTKILGEILISIGKLVSPGSTLQYYTKWIWMPSLASPIKFSDLADHVTW